MKALTNASIFTGREWLKNKAVLVDNGSIFDIRDPTDLPDAAERFDVGGNWLVPAFIDLQLYGGGGLLFGDHPSVTAISATYDYSLKGGATTILPTVATTSREKMFDAIDALKAYRKQGLPGVPGLHLEGPFINPAKKGAHAVQYIHQPLLHEVKALLEYGDGVIKMITLAPEVCSEEVVEYLLASDVIVSAGHSNATYEQAATFFRKGISAVTHLFNAMSPLHHRSPGLPAAIFEATGVSASVVADGHHVHFAAIRMAKQLMKERLFLITDAVTENIAGLYQHQFGQDKYVLPDGTLSGSALTLLKAVRNCIRNIDIPVEEALRMASLYPAKVLQVDHRLGKIEKGYHAEMIILSADLVLKGVFTSGSLTFF